MVTYTLTTWTPQVVGDPRPGYSRPKGVEQRKTLDAPNDEVALTETAKMLSKKEVLLVGTLHDKSDHLVTRCYTLHKMSKPAWDDPPEHINDSFQTFLAQNDEEATGKLSQQEDYNAGGGWEQVSLYGPDGIVKAVRGMPHYGQKS